MQIQDGEVAVTGAHRMNARATEQAALMMRWKKWVPDVNITMSAHDGPSIMMDDDSKRKHNDAASRRVCECCDALRSRIRC